MSLISFANIVHYGNSIMFVVNGRKNGNRGKWQDGDEVRVDCGVLVRR